MSHVGRTKGWPNPTRSLSPREEGGRRDEGARTKESGRERGREEGDNEQVASNCSGRGGAGADGRGGLYLTHPLSFPLFESTSESDSVLLSERPTDELWHMWDARLHLRAAHRTPTDSGVGTADRRTDGRTARVEQAAIPPAAAVGKS